VLLPVAVVVTVFAVVVTVFAVVPSTGFFVVSVAVVDVSVVVALVAVAGVTETYLIMICGATSVSEPYKLCMYEHPLTLVCSLHAATY
jgi:hypothetical protein